MKTCPTCGQLTVRDEPSTLRALLERVGGTGGELRQVYRGCDGKWYVTYGGGPFSAELVERMRRSGTLVPVYPGTPAERDALGLSSHYGSDSYLAKWKEILARSRQRSRAAA